MLKGTCVVHQTIPSSTEAFLPQVFNCVRGHLVGFPGKESACNAGDVGDVGSVPESGRSPGGGDGNPLQYSFLENPMDRGALWAMVQWVAKGHT